MAHKVYCEGCRYLRLPARPTPYGTQFTANPDVLEHLRRWEQKLLEIEQAERDWFQLGREFTYPPMFYDRCAWTAPGASERADHTGRRLVTYTPAARRNANHDCQHFEAGEPDPE